MKWYLSAALAILMLLTCTSCGRRRAVLAAPEQRQAMEEQIEDFRTWWLGPADVAPPSVEMAAREASSGGVSGTAFPLRPEDEAWNAWPDGQARLFNNRIALLFSLRIDGKGPLRWIPEGTLLELNDEAHPLIPGRTADEILRPLQAAALQQERWVLEGDLVERTRMAGPFRNAYLPLAAEDPPLEGVIAFPLQEPDLHVVAMRLTVQVATREGTEELVWVFD